MKKLLSFNILIPLILFPKFLISQCEVLPNPAPIYQTNYGYFYPPNNEFKVLVIFFEFDYLGTVADPQPNGTSEWPKNQLPNWKDNLFDVNPPSGVATGELTRYFQLASSGNFDITGEYLVSPTNNGLLSIPTVTGKLQEADIINIINTINTLMNGTIVTNQGVRSISDFDNYLLGYPSNQPNGFYRHKSTPGVNDTPEWDNVIFICRNATESEYTGVASTSFGPSPIGATQLLNYTMDSYVRTCAPNHAPIDILRHELSHGFIGGNQYHTGGGWGIPDNFWIPIISSFGMLSASNSTLQTWSGWDRHHLGWKNPANNYCISARDVNSNEINGDMTTDSQGGILILRDFATYGDEIRIKLPYIDSQVNFPQYVWIENHQGYTNNNIPFDRFNFEGSDACVDGIVQGLYMYIQIDADIKFSSSVNDISQIYSDYIYPLPANGFSDRSYSNCNQCITCIAQTNNKFEISNGNPLTGISDTDFGFKDLNSDNEINHNENLWHIIQDVNSVEYSELYQFGHSRHAFNLIGKSKISLGSNPSTASRMNLVSFDAPPPTHFWINGPIMPNNRKVYLNGISVEILEQMSSGDIKVQVRFDDVDVANDIRWCADEIVLNPIPTTSGYSLNLKTNKTITLARGTTPTRIDNPEYVNGYAYFNSPTVFNAEANAWIHLEEDAKIVVQDGSNLVLKADSKLELEAGAEIIVKSGSKLTLKAGAEVILYDNSRILIEPGGSLNYETSNITLEDNNSVLEIQGSLSLNNWSDFSFSGDGYILFPSAGAQSLLSGINASITLSGSGNSDKVLEVTSGVLNLEKTSLDVSDCKIELGQQVLILSRGPFSLQDVLVSNISGTAYPYNGIFLQGQPGIVIDNCILEKGLYGIYCSVNINSISSPLYISNSVFREFSNSGLVTMQRGAFLDGCTFNDNETGWTAYASTYPSEVHNTVFSENVVGIDYTATGSAGLYLNKTTVENQIWNGIEMDGSAMLTLKCSDVNGNGTQTNAAGIYITNNAFLNNASQLIPYGGSSDLSGNYHALWADHAGGWSALGGLNDFTSDNLLAKGTFNIICNINIAAHNNHWLTGTPSTPVAGTDYTLSPVMCPQYTIYIVDPNPDYAWSCSEGPAAFTPEEQSILDNANLIKNCPGAEIITTSDFPGMPLNEALETALEFCAFGMDSTGTGNEDNLQAIDMLNQIVTYPYSGSQYFNNAASEREGWLLSMAYLKLKESLGDAIQNGESACSKTCNYFRKALDAVDSVYAREFRAQRYNQAFYALMDKAGLYKMVNERDLALSTLDEFKSCFTLDSIQEDYLAKIRVTTFAEKQLINEEIPAGEFQDYFGQLYQNRLTFGNSVTVADSSLDSTYAEVYFTNDSITFRSPLFTDSVAWDFGDCQSGSGAEVSHAYTWPGVYTVTALTLGECSTDADTFSTTVTILPAFDISYQDSLIPMTCEADSFSITKSILPDTDSICTGAGFAHLTEDSLRFNIAWISDRPQFPNLTETWSYNDMMTAADSLIKVAVSKGDTIETLIRASLEYYTGGSWKSTTFTDSVLVTFGASGPFTATVSFDTTICQGDSIPFQTTVSGGAAPFSYYWNFNTYNPDSVEDPKPVFVHGGQQQLEVSVTDTNGCFATVLFEQGYRDAHDVSIPSQDTFDFYFDTRLCTTIMGAVNMSQNCPYESLQGINLVLTGTSGATVLETPATANYNGVFMFKASEVATLDTNLQYTIRVLSPKDYFLINMITADFDSLTENFNTIQIGRNYLDTVYYSATPYSGSSTTIVQSQDGISYTVGTSYDEGTGDFEIERIPSAGGQAWTILVDRNLSNEVAVSAAADSSGNVLVTGTTYNGSDTDIYTIKVDSMGYVVWAVQYADTIGSYDQPQHIEIDSTGTIIVTGQTDSPLEYLKAEYTECDMPQSILRVRPPGNTDSETLKEKIATEEIKRSIKVYPNPLSNEILFVEGDFRNDTRLEIYSSSGALIRVKSLKEGINEVDPGTAASGIYFYRILDLKKGEILKSDKLVRYR